MVAQPVAFLLERFVYLLNIRIGILLSRTVNVGNLFTPNFEFGNPNPKSRFFKINPRDLPRSPKFLGKSWLL